jgi:hypothetical protein
MQAPALLKTIGMYFLLILMAGILSGCNDDDDDDDDDTRTLRLINAVTDSPALYLYEEADDDDDDDIYITGAEYGHASAQSTVDDGDDVDYIIYTIDDDGDLDSLDLDFSASVDGDENLLIVLTGTMDDITLTLHTYDELDEEDEYGQVGLLNLSENQPSVDLYMAEDDDGVANTSVTLAAVNYEEFSGVTDLDEDEYNILLTVSGYTSRIYDAGDVDVDEDGTVLIGVVDAFGIVDDAIEMFKIDDSGSSTTRSNYDDDEDVPFALRFFNGVSNNDQAGVDIYFSSGAYSDGTPDIVGLEFEDASDYEELYWSNDEDDDYPEYNLYVTETGLPANIIYSGSLSLTRGSAYSVYIGGTYDDDDGDYEAGQELLEEEFREVSDYSRINFVNASATNDDEVDFYILERDQEVDDGTARDSDIDYLSSGSYLIQSGDYDLYVVSSDDDDELTDVKRISLEQGDNFTYVFTDNANGDYHLIKVDNDIDL